MKHKRLNVWLVVLCLMMTQLACPGFLDGYRDLVIRNNCAENPNSDPRCWEFIEEGIQDDPPLESALELEPSPIKEEPTKPTLETSEIQPGSTTELTTGVCAWVLTADSDGFPSGQVKEGMRVGPGDIPTSVHTYLSHGKSECGEQVFETYHYWYLDDVFYTDKESVTLAVDFGWRNIGTADCATLAMAGGSTSLSVGDFQIKAQNSNINIRTDPQGELSDSATWVVPEGAVGDILTITQNVSTGIYGKNIRWRYEYVCE